ncbi:MAG: DUF5686 family protein [Bacteroidia bacterium]|nr:DUF5686 family protein [Bacteroidia bacterium]
MVYSQSTKIRGKITDSETKEAVPFVSVYFKGSTIGTITDFDGNYFIETKKNFDSLTISCIGYKQQSVAVKKNSFQNHDIELKPSNFNLSEITVKPGVNPALRIIDKILENKEKNNQKNLSTYQYEVYNKIEVDVNNIDDKFKQNRAFKKIAFVFNYVDTNVVTGKSYLPIFITETLSDFYYRGEPKGTREVIKASKMSGVKNESISQFTGQMYQDVNIYDNLIPIFDQPFVSPISSFGKLYYKYYLVDSTFIDNKWCYQISFKPRRKQEFTFKGDFWVNDTTFAIKKSKIRLADDVNINYVHDFVAENEYESVNGTWFQTLSTLFIDLNLTNKTKGLFGRKTTSYKNIIVDQPIPKNIFAEKTDIIVKLDALDKSDEYWQKSRHLELTNKEKGIYEMVDSVKNVPIFKTFANVVTAFVTGYYTIHKFEIGPYYTLFSYNKTEGNRYRFGGRTSDNFSKSLMFEGHIAYGSADEKIKYGLGATYIFNRSPRSAVSLLYLDDIEQLGKSQNAFLDDNILSSVLERRPFDKMTSVRRAQGSYEKEWMQGFSNKITLTHDQLFPTILIPLNTPTGNLSSLNTSEIKLNTHFAWHERIVNGEFEQTSLGSDFPIIDFSIVYGLKGVFNSKYQYSRLNLNITHYFNTGTVGYINYAINAGQIFGDVPYPLLKLHEGNETFAFDPLAFNMMNYYEFASDKWASLFVEYHFMGFFLNKIPLLRKLKLREVAYGRGLIGSLSDDHSKIVDFPTNLHGLTKPYYEAGVGIENILKIIRVDAVWRLSYLDNPEIQKFGLRVSLQLQF